jgi:TetR/AcrR family transcriptional repressor of nem operon
MAHRDAPATGCPLAAMGSELARSDAPTREAATRGFEQLIQVWAGAVGAEPSVSVSAEAMVAACALVGIGAEVERTVFGEVRLTF